MFKLLQVLELGLNQQEQVGSKSQCGVAAALVLHQRIQWQLVVVVAEHTCLLFFQHQLSVHLFQ
jgi:hypothetical protein